MTAVLHSLAAEGKEADWTLLTDQQLWHEGKGLALLEKRAVIGGLPEAIGKGLPVGLKRSSLVGGVLPRELGHGSLAVAAEVGAVTKEINRPVGHPAAARRTDPAPNGGRSKPPVGRPKGCHPVGGRNKVRGADGNDLALGPGHPHLPEMWDEGTRPGRQPVNPRVARNDLGPRGKRRDHQSLDGQMALRGERVETVLQASGLRRRRDDNRDRRLGHHFHFCL